MVKRRTAKKERKEDRFFSLVLFVISVFFLCGTLFTVSSCGKTEEPVKQAQKKRPAKNKTKKTAAKKPDKTSSTELTVSGEYSYDATGKPDPFLPLVTETAPRQREPSQKKAEPLTPLQKYDLKELKLVAVISLGNNSSALLEDPAKFGYIVKDGMLIGKNDGIIKKITENGIIVEEKVYNSMGELETKISTLTIQHQE